MTWEFSVLDGIQHLFSSTWGNWFWPLFTKLGSGGIIWILLALWMLLVKKDRQRGVMTLVALLLCLLVGNLLLKNIVARERPFSFLPNMGLLIAIPNDYSFPSGHTMSSFAAAYCLSLGRHWWVKVIYFTLASAMAFSRLYIYVHFPTDILAGVVLGLISGILAKKIIGQVKKQPWGHILS